MMEINKRAANPSLRRALCWIGMALAVQAYRFYPYLRLPQFWGEDGPIFFKQAYDQGWSSLWRTCDGYLHLYARLIALVAQTVPMAYAPHVFVAGSLLAQLLCFRLIWSARFAIPESARGPFTLATALIPHGGEVPFNLTNAQWYLALALIVMLVHEPPRHRGEWLSDSLCVVLCGFSGPFLALFLPGVWAIRMATRHPMQRWEIAKWAVSLGVAFMHFSQWHLQERQHHVASTIDPMIGDWINALVNLVLPFYFAHTTPQWYQQAPSPLYVALAAAACVGTVRLAFPRRDAWLPLRLTFLLCGGVCYVGGLWENRDHPFKLHPYSDGQRSYFILYIVIAWLIILTGVSAVSAPVSQRRLRWATVLVLSFVAGSSLLCASDVIARGDFHFNQQVQWFQSHHDGLFINPPGWRFSLHRRGS